MMPLLNISATGLRAVGKYSWQIVELESFKLERILLVGKNRVKLEKLFWARVHIEVEPTIGLECTWGKNTRKIRIFMDYLFSF